MPPQDDPTSIGNVLIELGFCSEEDVNAALIEMEQPSLMGEILLRDHKITAVQLEWALTYQRCKRNQIAVPELKAFQTRQRRQLVSELAELRPAAALFALKVKGSA